MNETVANDLRFFRELSPFVFMLETVVVMTLVTRNAEVGIFGLAIFPGNVVFTKFAGYFLRDWMVTSLSSLYLVSLMVNWTI